MSKDKKHKHKHEKHGHDEHEHDGHGHGHGHDDEGADKHDRRSLDTATVPAALAFGVDIGGSGIKGAPVDVASGAFERDRVRIPTPQPSTPEAVARTVAEVVASFDLAPDVPLGVTFPAVILHGVAQSAANVDKSWIGTDVEGVVAEATGRHVLAVNDADAAGFAEVQHGAAKDVRGVVLVATLGTGIGSALFVDGRLVPNTELGHLEIDGHDAESRAADSARDREGLDWEQWAQRLQRYFSVVENLFWPDLIVVGGGVSKKHESFLPLLDLRTRIVPAALRNDAGIIGAAALAAQVHQEERR
ncbi:polyphosphate--glucose phosphotransferase [Cellulomonas marina]|uniref:Polyphosphate glucokinase n=1 Tax=Cellulomonas marina TaxID=988821 RepID=A0A1I0VXX8_9CELL|nr:ROK family protein [Cellulomonas marina]GIG27473.1 polyphosphate glucokinase [Cellulomonas marina]SFA81269.1 polyphosphate glucokinase [Cellulomonas marina]